MINSLTYLDFIPRLDLNSVVEPVWAMAFEISNGPKGTHGRTLVFCYTMEGENDDIIEVIYNLPTNGWYYRVANPKHVTPWYAFGGVDFSKFDHNSLAGKDALNQHPISSIVGLQDALSMVGLAQETLEKAIEIVAQRLTDMSAEMFRVGARVSTLEEDAIQHVKTLEELEAKRDGLYIVADLEAPTSRHKGRS